MALIILTMAFTALGYTTDNAVAATKKPKKITLKVTAKTVDVKGKVTVSVKSVKPANASKKVTYKSSNKKIAKVTKKGIVKGLKAGTVRITATSKSAKKVKAKIKIKVKNIKPSSITLNKTAVSLQVGKDSFTLIPTLKPVGVYNAGVTYSSSNEKVATVSSKGVVKAITPGTAIVTAKTKEKGKTATCTVTVTDENVLNGWVMTGYYKSDKINNVNIASDAELHMWDSVNKGFIPTTKSSKKVLGNYVQLYDTNEDGTADLIQVIKYSDGSSFWNAETAWVDGVGNVEPYLSDEIGSEMFNENHRIPMGERLLTTFGLGDWSGTTDFNNYENSPYWQNTDYDFYSLGSNDNLTMLTRYKTALQTTGSTCVMTSALSVLDWYGERGDLNERDLSSLRGEDRAGKVGGTSLGEAKKVFDKLGEMGITGDWNMSSWEGDQYKLYDSDWIKEELSKGHPIIVIWNSFGGHGQVIIGYDDMGTADVQNDDVLIMMDPYDTTDHNADGYIIQSYQRLAYGLLSWSDTGVTNTKFLSVWPKDWEYSKVQKDGMINDSSNTNDFSDLIGKIPYGNTAADIENYYPSTDLYGSTNNLSGPASDTYFRSGDHDGSPYYKIPDFYGTEADVRTNVGSDTLNILEEFETVQQATEWTCGTASALMNINWFDKNKERINGDFVGQLETDISLAWNRQEGQAGATLRAGMKEVFDYMNSEYSQDWVYFTNEDLDDPEGDESYIGDYCLQAGSETPGWDGLIPYLIEEGIPMMIGTDEWGGHWQLIIGYDSMGTEGTQDDVLILAEPYDTTDHNQDGYLIESFERLVYGWGSAFENESSNDFIVAFPTEGHENVISDLGLQQD